jgi:hypothetical protein
MRRVLLATALLCLFAADARCDPLPPDAVLWQYDWTPGAANLTADGNPKAGVTFTGESTKTAAGSTDVVATNLQTYSNHGAGSPDTFNVNGTYSLTMNLSLTQDGVTYTDSLTFTGKLNGTFSQDNAQVYNTFTDGGPKVTQLGSYTFTVTLASYTPPGPPSQNNAGSIGAHVQLDAIHTESVPEPSALALSCLGGVALLGVSYRQWRTRRRLS